MSTAKLSADSGEYKFTAVPMLGRSALGKAALGKSVDSPSPATNEDFQAEANTTLDIPDAEQLKAELAATDDSPSQMQKVMQSIKEFASLGSLLRLAGTTSMIVALGFFLFDGFQSAVEHQHRFWILLGFSSITAVSGIAISHLFKDQKGARSLVSVALISVPACFAVLGALVYSMFPLDGLSADYPKYLLWQAVDVSQLTLAAAVCGVVTAVVGFVGFSVVAKQIRMPLFASLMFGSLLLVVPVRESFWAVVVAVAIVLVAAVMFFRYIKPSQTVKTGWSAFAISLTALPFVIALARGAWLYDLPVVFMLAGSAVAHFALAFYGRSLDGHPRVAAEIVSIFSGLVVVYFASQSSWVAESVIGVSLSHYEGILLAGLIGGLFLHLDHFISNSYVARACRILYSLTWGLVLMMSTLFFNPPGFLIVVVIVMLIATFAYGISQSYRSLSIVAASGTLLLVFRYQEDLLNVVYGSGILGAVVFGIVCVVAAHLLEKHGPVLKARFAQKAGIAHKGGA